MVVGDSAVRFCSSCMSNLLTLWCCACQMRLQRLRESVPLLCTQYGCHLILAVHLSSRLNIWITLFIPSTCLGNKVLGFTRATHAGARMCKISWCLLHLYSKYRKTFIVVVPIVSMHAHTIEQCNVSLIVRASPERNNIRFPTYVSPRHRDRSYIGNHPLIQCA